MALRGIDTFAKIVYLYAVTNPSNNRARRRATLMIETIAFTTTSRKL